MFVQISQKQNISSFYNRQIIYYVYLLSNSILLWLINTFNYNPIKLYVMLKKYFLYNISYLSLKWILWRPELVQIISILVNIETFFKKLFRYSYKLLKQKYFEINNLNLKKISKYNLNE